MTEWPYESMYGQMVIWVCKFEAKQLHAKVKELDRRMEENDLQIGR